MANFDTFFPTLLRVEGGFVDDPDDPGGATNKGITMQTFSRCARNLLGVEPTLANLRALTNEQAGKVYKALYWDKVRGDDISLQDLADIVFDFYVNAGANATRLLQTVMNAAGARPSVEVDGDIGPLTIKALQALDQRDVYRRYKQGRIEYYEDLAANHPSLAKFLQGWLNRVNAFPDLRARPVTAGDWRVAGASVPPGTRVRASLDLTELADGSRVTLPLALIHGGRPGPTLYVGAAIHGDEANGVAIAGRLIASLDPAALAGRLICVPVQNPLAFQVDHRVPVGLYLKSPLDQAPIDPWTTFPGDPAGNITERLSHALFSLIRQCDAAIDIHTPTRGGRYVPIAILPHPSLSEFSRAEALALAFGSGYVMATDQGLYVRDGVLCVEATRAGVPCFTFEIGEGGRVEEEATSLGLRFVANAMRHLGMLPGAPEPPAHALRMRSFLGLRAARGGLLTTDAALGARVPAGATLARIHDIYGDLVEAISAPRDGIFVRATTFSAVAAGERVATLGLE